MHFALTIYYIIISRCPPSMVRISPRNYDKTSLLYHNFSVLTIHGSHICRKIKNRLISQPVCQRHKDSNLGMTESESVALPLGHGAIPASFFRSQRLFYNKEISNASTFFKGLCSPSEIRPLPLPQLCLPQ